MAAERPNGDTHQSERQQRAARMHSVRSGAVHLYRQQECAQLCRCTLATKQLHSWLVLQPAVP